MDTPLKQQVRERYGNKMVTPQTIEDNKGYDTREALGWQKFRISDRIKSSMDKRVKEAVERVGEYLAPALGDSYSGSPRVDVMRNIETAAIPKANKIQVDRRYALASQKELEGTLGEEYTHLAHGVSNPETDPTEEHDKGKYFEKSSVSETAGGLGRLIVESRYGTPKGLNHENLDDLGHKHGYSAAEKMYGSNPDTPSRMNELKRFVKMPLKDAKSYVDKNSSYKISLE